MDWNEWEARDHQGSQYAGLVRRQPVEDNQARAPKAVAATLQSSGADAQDYRMHMLLSTLMLIAALVIANLQ